MGDISYATPLVKAKLSITGRLGDRLIGECDGRAKKIQFRSKKSDILQRRPQFLQTARASRADAGDGHSHPAADLGVRQRLCAVKKMLDQLPAMLRQRFDPLPEQMMSFEREQPFIRRLLRGVSQLGLSLTLRVVQRFGRRLPPPELPALPHRDGDDPGTELRLFSQ